jgi:hypothetical protein
MTEGWIAALSQNHVNLSSAHSSDFDEINAVRLSYLD